MVATTKSFLLEIFNTDEMLIPVVNLLNNEGVKFKLIEKKEEPRPFSSIYNKKSLGKKGLIILELLSKGYTYNEIANEVDISIDGVRFYVKKIYKALDVDNGRDAVRIFLIQSKQLESFV